MEITGPPCGFANGNLDIQNILIDKNIPYTKENHDDGKHNKDTYVIINEILNRQIQFQRLKEEIIRDSVVLKALSDIMNILNSTFR